MNATIIILQALNDSRPHLQPEDTLQHDVTIRTGQTCSDKDFQDALAELRADGLIERVVNRLTGSKWSITDKGRMELKNANLD